MMRRKQSEITDKKEITTILSTARIGRLATLGEDGYPYITPVNFVYWQESIYFHCALKGEKLDNIEWDNRVCFEVDIALAYLDTGFDAAIPPCDVGQFYQSVIIRGTAEIVTESAEKVAALNALMASHEGVVAFTGITHDSPAVGMCAVVAVRVKTLSAKANLAQKKNQEEKNRIRTYLQKRNLPGDMETASLIR